MLAVVSRFVYSNSDFWLFMAEIKIFTRPNNLKRRESTKVFLLVLLVRWQWWAMKKVSNMLVNVFIYARPSLFVVRKSGQNRMGEESNRSTISYKYHLDQHWCIHSFIHSFEVVLVANFETKLLLNLKTINLDILMCS